MITPPKEPYKPKQVIGLGDVVGSMAKPIAIVSDAVLKTDLKNCGGCAKRKEKLNSILPNLNPFTTP